MHALGLFPLLRPNRKAVADRDPLDHEHLVALEDLADGFYLVLLRVDLDLTRLQRAGKGAGQSAAGGGHDIVERRGVRREVLGLDPVVLGDLGVDAEHDRLLLGR